MELVTQEYIKQWLYIKNYIIFAQSA